MSSCRKGRQSFIRKAAPAPKKHLRPPSAAILNTASSSFLLTKAAHRQAKLLRAPCRIGIAPPSSGGGRSEKDWFRNKASFLMVPPSASPLHDITLQRDAAFKSRTTM